MEQARHTLREKLQTYFELARIELMYFSDPQRELFLFVFFPPPPAAARFGASTSAEGAGTDEDIMYAGFEKSPHYKSAKS